MFLIVPYSVDVPMERMPWMNWVIMGVTVLCYPLMIGREDLTELGYWMTVGGKGWFGLLGHALVHGDFLHLFGNMLFLWVFGNAVCAKVGNLWYPLVYGALAVASASWAYAVDPRPVIGASGAINGVVGMYVIWYLLNDISCLVVFGLRPTTFSVSSFWMVLMWFAFDIWGAVGERSGVAHLNHVTGFVWGAALATLMIAGHFVVMDRDERSLLEVMGFDWGPKRRRRSVS